MFENFCMFNFRGLPYPWKYFVIKVLYTEFLSTNFSQVTMSLKLENFLHLCCHKQNQFPYLHLSLQMSILHWFIVKVLWKVHLNYDMLFDVMRCPNSRIYLWTKTWYRFNNAWQTNCLYSHHCQVIRKSKRSGSITEFVRIQVSINHSLNWLYTALLANMRILIWHLGRRYLPPPWCYNLHVW